MQRRAFVHAAGLSVLGVGGCRTLSSAPTAPTAAPGRPALVSGRVVRLSDDGTTRRGIARVALSDGVTVTTTDADGYFALGTNSSARALLVTVPAGYALPRTSEGLLRNFVPMAPDASGEMQVRVGLVPFDGDALRHDALVLGDPQPGNEQMASEFLATSIADVGRSLAADGPVQFGMTVGDLVGDDPSLFRRYTEGVGRLGVTFGQTIGNHDLDPRPGADPTAAYRRAFGPTYYSFDCGEIHYVVLDSIRPAVNGWSAGLDPVQLGWLAADLDQVERGRTVAVFTHVPPTGSWSRRAGGGDVFDAASRATLLELLAPFQARVFAGHTHEIEHAGSGSYTERSVGAVCGAWWTGPVCWDGTPRGYLRLQARGSELRWRYRSVGRTGEHQLRATLAGDAQANVQRLVANAWDADARWTLGWVASDGRRGGLERRRGIDPCAAYWCAPERERADMRWVRAIRTDHLYFADIPGDARDVVVEATNGWGERFVAPARDADEPPAA